MFLIKWLTDSIWNFGALVGLVNKKGTILFLGLDNAGKSTLLVAITEQGVRALPPTLHPTHQEIKIGNVQFTIHDLGGHENARKLWNNYTFNVSAVVYMIDIADPERWDESKEVLEGLMNLEQMKSVPIAVLANKIDAENARSDMELIDRFALGPHINATHEHGRRPLRVFPCSVFRKEGYVDAFGWISGFLD